MDFTLKKIQKKFLKNSQPSAVIWYQWKIFILRKMKEWLRNVAEGENSDQCTCVPSLHPTPLHISQSRDQSSADTGLTPSMTPCLRHDFQKKVPAHVHAKFCQKPRVYDLGRRVDMDTLVHLAHLRESRTVTAELWSWSFSGSPVRPLTFPILKLYNHGPSMVWNKKTAISIRLRVKSVHDRRLKMF